MGKWIHRLFCRSLLILGLPCATLAMVPVHDLIEPTVRFYRSSSSLFPSGEASLFLLKEKQISTRLETWYWVDGGGAKDWLPAQNLFYLHDFYLQTIAEQSGILTDNVAVLRLKKGWRPEGTLKEGAELIINSIRSDWACGKDKFGPVCVPTNKVLLAIDAAQRVETNGGRWHRVKYRMGHQMVTDTNQLIPITGIKGWEAQANYAFIRPLQTTTVSRPNTIGTFAAFERVLLLKKEIRRWNQSLLLDHGNVWWQNTAKDEGNQAPIILTKDELEYRQIHDQTKHAKFSLVSADGIFFSNDGDTWTLLKQFGESNFPVAIGPRETLVVGDQLSFDQGKTFQNYLRWDQIALQAQRVLSHSPKHLRLQAVKPFGRSSLQVEIETGYKILVFEFNTINSQILYLRSFLRR